MTVRFADILLALTALSSAMAGPAAAGEVSFTASDGVAVFAELHESANGRSAPSIVLFHQGDADGRGEYERIFPVLTVSGYNVLLVDQRSGGDVFGGRNRTAAGIDDSVPAAYCDAYPDLDAAVDFMRGSAFDGPLAVWGSSYSAALVFRVAANRDDVDAVLAFSPASGGPLADCRPDEVLEEIEVPVLALRPVREAGIPSVQAQMQAFAAVGIDTVVAEPGAHGSSMLDASRVGASTAATWVAVLDFLARSLPGLSFPSSDD